MKKYFSYLPALFMDLCISSVLVGTSFHSSSDGLGLSTSFIGIINAVGSGIYVCLAVILGKASDRDGRERSLYIGTLLFTILSLAISRCKNAFCLALVFPLLGLSKAFFWPAYEAWIAERYEEGNLQRRVRNFNVSWSLGIMLGAFIPGYLYQLSPLLTFYLASIISLLTFGIIRLQTKSSGLKSDVKRIEEIPEKTAEIKQIYLYIAWIANFSSYFTLGILRSLSPKMAVETGIKAGTFSNLMLLLGIARTTMFFCTGTKSFQKLYYRLLPLIFVQVLGAAALFSMGKFYNIYIWAIAFFMIGITVSMTYFSSMYYGLHGNLDKGGKSGWHEAILASGALVGPFVGGIVADQLNPQSPYLICGVLYLVSIIGGIILRFWKHSPRASQS